MSSTTGDIALCDLDEQGNQLSEQELVQAERVLRVAHHGKFDPRIEKIVSKMDVGEKHWVIVWLPVDEPAGAAGSNLLRDPELAHHEQERVHALLEAAVSRLTEILPEGTSYSWPGGASPFVRVRSNVATMRRLSSSNEVGAIYDGEEPLPVPAGTPSCLIYDPINQYALTNATWVHQVLGGLGDGVKVATVYEDVCNYPTLPFDSMDPIHVLAPNSCDFNTEFHGTIVMGYIANTNPCDPELHPEGYCTATVPPSHAGMAPGAELFNANTNDPVDAFHFIGQHGISLVNRSAVSDLCAQNTLYPCHVWSQSFRSALDDYYATHYPYVLAIDASGNDILGTCGADCEVVANWIHNGLLVGGATTHTATTPDTDRTLDRTLPYLFRNPTPGYLEVGDQELPHMTSYADLLRISVDNPTGCGGAGTSYGTPIATGAAILAAEQNPQLYGRH